MITAHSGSDGYQDNSLAFIEAVLESGVPAFEIDAQLAEDGTIYLSHDVLEDWSDCLLLEEVFEKMQESSNDSIIINVDCKNGRLGCPVFDLAHKFGLFDRVYLSGALNLEDYTLAERAHLFYNLENQIDPAKIQEINLNAVLQSIAAQGIKVVQSYHGYCTPELMVALAQSQLKISVWTVNDAEEIDHYLDMGCYNVTSRIAMAYLGGKNEI